MSVLDKVRSWIDGDSSERVLEQAARDAQVKPHSKAEEFIVEIARAVGSVMQAEMVPLPQGTVIIPSEYTICMSAEDDKDWQGVKRSGLEQGLYHVLASHAKELAGKRKLETRSFVIGFRIDATLAKGDVSVQHSWDDPGASKTGVLARPAAQLTEANPQQTGISAAGNAERATVASLKVPTSEVRKQAIMPTDMPASRIEQAQPLEDSEEMTRVATRAKEFYRLEVWRNGVRQAVVPIYKEQVVVGRGSKSKPVDITLAGDVEVSRRHLSIGADGKGGFWVVNEGKNPAALGDRELPAGQRVAVTPGTIISVCSYALRIQLS